MKALNFLTSPPYPAIAEADLESLFLDSDSMPLSFEVFVRDLLGISLWAQCSDLERQYSMACVELSREIDCFNGQLQAEPAYHSRKHFRDVCVAISLLISRQTEVTRSNGNASDPWALSREDAWILLLSAMGHDFGHPGGVNQSPAELELMAIGKIRQAFLKTHLPEKLIESLITHMSPIILATDPQAFSQLVSACTDPNELPSHSECLSMLMVEADLLASTLPIKGGLLSSQLAKEWEGGNPAQATKVASPEGRRTFLQHIQFVSPQAKAVGIERIRLDAIAGSTNLKLGN